jgi:hypothetical protein
VADQVRHENIDHIGIQWQFLHTDNDYSSSCYLAAPLSRYDSVRESFQGRT